MRQVENHSRLVTVGLGNYIKGEMNRLSIDLVANGPIILFSNSSASFRVPRV